MGASSLLMPWLAVLYMMANITLNLSAITLVKRGGAVATMVFFFYKFFFMFFYDFFYVHGANVTLKTIAPLCVWGGGGEGG